MTTMDDLPFPAPAGPGSGAPVTEADLHAYVDRQLSASRRTEVEVFLSSRADDLERVRDWQKQNELLRGLLGPVVDAPLPLRLPLRPEASRWPWRAIAAAAVVAVASAALAWAVRGSLDAAALRVALAAPASADAELAGFAHRAAVAHVVYSPEVRRPVEVGADQEQALVTWLTRRMGAAVHPPALSALGYELIGGRLLPGDKGPVAQFMYGSVNGQRLTLYVTRELAGQDTSFRFAKDGPVNVFYWVEDRFAYAISAGADREELLKVSQEVYRQLKPAS
jgi:anti-sigma factor RsiW